jgi:alpha-beta hydrolase superfamily lysophospholipase
MRSPEAQNAKTNEIIAGVKVPVLFIHGEQDDVVAADEVNELLGILKKAGNRKAELRFIPDAKHDCMENPSFTVDTLVEWIMESRSGRKKKD